MRARGALRAVARDGRTAIELLRGEAPLGLFRAPGPRPGWARVWLVGSAGGPLGGDDVELCIDVGEGAALVVGSVAASVVLGGVSRSRLVVRATVATGAALVWAPEPLLVTSGADHGVEVSLDVARGAHLWWRDELVLGRVGESPGRCTIVQRADLGGCPWVRNELAIGAPGWDSGAVVGPHRALGSVLTSWRKAAGDPHPVGSPHPASAAGAASGPVDRHPVVGAEGMAADLLPEVGGTLTVALAPDRLALDALLGPPDFPVLQRSHHDAASRLDA